MILQVSVSIASPGLFWIPIPEIFFQSRDWDENWDLPFSSHLVKHVHISAIYGNFG